MSTRNFNRYPRCGAAYEAQIEYEHLFIEKLLSCTNCSASAREANISLKRCSGCQLDAYCSKECQRSRWPKHKAFCNMVLGKGAKNAYLSDYSPKEAFRIFIDSYRMRVESDHVHSREGHGMYYSGQLKDGSVWAEGDAIQDFQKYLDLAETAGVLPDWWHWPERMECLKRAIEADDENILLQFDQASFASRYGGDIGMVTALAILAELIVGFDGKGPPKDDDWFESFLAAKRK